MTPKDVTPKDDPKDCMTPKDCMWMNVVTSCRSCNHRKSHRTPKQVNMPLLYAPYVPSLWEDFILRNRRILADQMEFLMAHVPKSSRLLI